MVVSPVAPLALLLFVLLLGVLILLVQIRVLSYAYRKIGVRPRYVFAVLVLTLIGSQVNVPLYRVTVDGPVSPRVRAGARDVRTTFAPPRTTLVAINVGGALIPILVSIYLVARTGMVVRMALATVIVAGIVHHLARIVPGAGIAVPMLAPPLAAAAVALILAFRRAPPVAYVAGSMGALIGADLMNLHRLAAIGAPVVSIGGAGTFDGVFLTGIIAGLLA